MALVSAKFTPNNNFVLGAGSEQAKLTVYGTTSDGSTAGLNVINSSSNSVFSVRNDGRAFLGAGTPVLIRISAREEMALVCWLNCHAGRWRIICRSLWRR